MGEQRSLHNRNWPVQMPALLATHVLLLLGATWFCSNSSPTSLLASIAGSAYFAQACLIGIWLGVRRSRSLWRWGVAAVGVGLIGTASGFAQWAGFGGGPDFLTIYVVISLALMAVLTTVTTVLLLVARKWYNAVLVSGWRTKQGQGDGFQFGVRHLLMVTFVVAILLGLRGAGSRLLLETGPILILPFIGVAWGVPCLVVLWATLGTKRPHERLAVAMVFVFLVAMLTPFYFFGEDWQRQDFWRLALTIVAIFTEITGSLLVVRTAGYRLARDLRQDWEPATIAEP
jgi:hypothetical protein